ncbi:hypothetical protein J8273_0123 [Carpediemonas membranifera]|uniref:Uncharacterized protein n=1 Tax=Carpediemonas membranifera TaxID=201153 RepID=A0A8J6EAM6_9EUKA|nr:hypothetical protein J8273_0123 [Carpediemonas membranifera]|eukprot:KAG9394915.1 hypothetical protein J8273_0123 [Carpediemonas membranifera]
MARNRGEKDSRKVAPEKSKITKKPVPVAFAEEQRVISVKLATPVVEQPKREPRKPVQQVKNTNARSNQRSTAAKKEQPKQVTPKSRTPKADKKKAVEKQKGKKASVKLAPAILKRDKAPKEKKERRDRKDHPVLAPDAIDAMLKNYMSQDN